MEKLLVAVLCFIGLTICGHLNRPMTRSKVKTMSKHHDVVPEIIDESENFDRLVGSLSRVFGIKNKENTLREERRDSFMNTPQVVSPSSSSGSSAAASYFSSQRPESPQSVVAVATVKRKTRPQRHRRVKSIGDIDSILVTPV
nr:PREDICTED: uncharacterized protein LOC109039723 [Bemisia tabaci]